MIAVLRSVTQCEYAIITDKSVNSTHCKTQDTLTISLSISSLPFQVVSGTAVLPAAVLRGQGTPRTLVVQTAVC
jgi:hypothetical protein